MAFGGNGLRRYLNACRRTDSSTVSGVSSAVIMMTSGGVASARACARTSSPLMRRQADVQEDDVEGALPQEGEGLGAVPRGLHVMAHVFQQCGQRQTQPPVIVDDQNTAAGCGLRIHLSIL